LSKSEKKEDFTNQGTRMEEGTGEGRKEKGEEVM
jgi:hypothetical protein